MNEMNLEQLEARAAEIEAELETADEARLAELQAEAEELASRKAELLEAETRNREAEALNKGAVIPTKVKESEHMEERKMFGIDTKEYRDAFYAYLVQRATPEQKEILENRGFTADSTTGAAYGTGVALPAALDTAIWDQVASAHPILGDVARVNSGIVLKVTRVTAAGISKKMDDASTSEQTISAAADVNLVGADFHTYLTITYAEAKMSQGALEQFVIKEIADAIGAALAADIYARIISDVTSGNAVSKSTGSYFEAIASALAAAPLADNPVIYATPAAYYGILGETDSNGQPIVRDGVNLMGATLKKDSAIPTTTASAGIVICDPDQFVLNVVQDTLIESQRDVAQAKIVIGGYMRAEGCMRKLDAGSYITT